MFFRRQSFFQKTNEKSEQYTNLFLTIVLVLMSRTPGFQSNALPANLTSFIQPPKRDSTMCGDRVRFGNAKRTRCGIAKRGSLRGNRIWIGRRRTNGAFFLDSFFRFHTWIGRRTTYGVLSWDSFFWPTIKWQQLMALHSLHNNLSFCWSPFLGSLCLFFGWRSVAVIIRTFVGTLFLGSPFLESLCLFFGWRSVAVIIRTLVGTLFFGSLFLGSL
jgi:hypothetical protein